jgi:uncharacterized SAM-binding protein YcdF (DUF218 family)
VALFAIVATGFPIYVWPPVDTLKPADAVFILGGNGYSRYPFGLGLGEKGFAPVVAISNPAGPGDPWLTKQCSEGHPEFKVICFQPEPSTTAGEAQQLKRLADEYGWKSVIAVTFRPHVARAGFILEQCFDGELIMTSSPEHVPLVQWGLQFVYQTAGFVKAILKPAC